MWGSRLTNNPHQPNRIRCPSFTQGIGFHGILLGTDIQIMNWFLPIKMCLLDLAH
jgi:hypothetical protein